VQHEIIQLCIALSPKRSLTPKCDLVPFVANVMIVFPKGRMFARFKQLDQVAKLFLDAWVISKVHGGQSKIHCAHGLSHGKSQQLHSAVSLQRKCSPAEKAKHNCSFEIKYYSPHDKPKKTTPDTNPIFFPSQDN
jgi:hypothetical protein